jgi:hypothetical protein
MFILSLIVENGNDHDTVQACTDFIAVMKNYSYSQLLATPGYLGISSESENLVLSTTTISTQLINGY